MPRLTQADIEAIEERVEKDTHLGFRFATCDVKAANAETRALLTEIKALQAERDRMVEALEFTAQIKCQLPPEVCTKYGPCSSCRARAVLQEMKEVG
jgi:hypothetical protein